MSINISITNGQNLGMGNGINVPAAANISDIDTKPKTPKVEAPEVETPDLAVSYLSEQGDNLSVTKEGMQSQLAGGTIQTEGEDGTVARRDDIQITTENKVSERLKDMLKDTIESKSDAIHNAVESLREQDEEVNDRQAYMIGQNASFTMSDPAYLPEDATKIQIPN